MWRQLNGMWCQPDGMWRQPDGIPSRVECAGSHTSCILDLLKDSKELSSISDCFGDQKAIKTPKLNTIWLEFIARVLNMLIGLKGDNYYSKVFKRVNYKLWNSTFWVVINPYLFSFIKLLYHLYKLPLFFNYIMKSNIHYSVYNNLIFNRKYFTPYSNVPNASGQQNVILNASSYIIYDVWYPKPLYMKDKISSLEARSNNRFITSMQSMIPTEWLYWDYENIHAPSLELRFSF